MHPLIVICVSGAGHKVPDHIEGCLVEELVQADRPSAAHQPTDLRHCNRVENSIIGFSSESIVFCDRKIDSIVKKIKSLTSIFIKDRRDRLAHG